MALDGMFVRELSKELNSMLLNGRIDTIDGINKTDYIFKIRVPGKTYNLYTSVSYNNPTVFLTEKKFEKPLVASSFTMFLRKHLEGGYIESIEQYNNDRVIMIHVRTSNELDGEVRKIICIELIGRFANLLILDENLKIIEAIKQLSVFECENSRGIMKGLKYESLKNEKLSPDDKESINNIFSINENLYPQKIVDSISGVSPNLAKYLITNYMDSKEDFYSFFEKETSTFSPVLKGTDYYYFDIFGGSVEHFQTLSELLYTYYQRNAEAKILKDNNQQIFQTVSSNLKRLEKKLVKLDDELKRDENSDDLRLKGEILLANAYNAPNERHSTITLNNYYTNEPIEIPIDPSKSIKDNSSLYFKKYKKAKIAIEHIKEQISIAENEKEYFSLLSYQIKNASLKDLIEIKNELISFGYIHSKDNNSKKKQKPNFLSFDFDGCKIFVGKNNIQNDYLTHTFAKKDDLWFHVKGDHGSHVIVEGERKYEEDIIRYAAKLAAMYSEAKDSSSVPVDYTEIKFIKKVPGRKGSFVTYKKYKTIYIDPKRD